MEEDSGMNAEGKEGARPSAGEDTGTSSKLEEWIHHWVYCPFCQCGQVVSEEKIEVASHLIEQTIS